MLLLTVIFGRETYTFPTGPHNTCTHDSCRYLDRRNPSAPDLIPDGKLSSRVKALIGVLGPQMTAQRFSLKEDFLRMLRLVWRPHLLGVMIYEVRLRGPPSRACLFIYCFICA